MTSYVAGVDFEVRPYHHGHEGFVMANYSKLAHVSSRPLVHALGTGRAQCLVASVYGYPDDLLAYAVVQRSAALTQPAVWWAFTRPKNRKRKLCAQLLALLGVDTSFPTLYLAWSTDLDHFAQTHPVVRLQEEFRTREDR